MKIKELSSWLSFFSLIFMLTPLFVFLCAASPSNQVALAEPPTLLVSVAPYKFFLERLAQNTVKVLLMVPTGASAHTYEPTPKEMLAASHAAMWFTIGEGFEARSIKAIKSYQPQLLLVDLRKEVSLITDNESKGHVHACSNPHCQDLHIWLSPRQAQIQVQTIANTLITHYPSNRALYEANLVNLLADLQVLDQEINRLLQPLKKRTILVSHPAYAYFCRDYNLTQVSIEFEGKDPTPRQLTRLFDIAKKEQIKTIFVQSQYSNKGARLIAAELGCRVINLEPYAENYFSTMRQIAQQIAVQ